MTPVVVTVAPNGARRTKADHPNLPITPAEIAAEAARCADAGATILHLHVRDGAGQHSLDPELYRAAIQAVGAAVGERMVVQVTTEAVGRYTAAEQMRVVRELRPEAVSLGLRELIPDEASVNDAASFLAWLRAERIAPQYILYDPADVARFAALRRQGVIPQARPWALFVLGRYVDPVEVRPRDMLALLRAHDGESPWALCAFGPQECACMLTAAGLGGHVRVGFENNLLRPDGRLAESNAELILPVQVAAPLLGRTLADAATTRAFLAETAA